MDLPLTPIVSTESVTSSYEVSARALQSAQGPVSPEKIREAADAFEGYFISYLLKSMRETVHEGFLKNEAGGMFHSFYDQELGRLAAKAGGLGVGAMVENYIRDQQNKTDNSGLKFSTEPADKSSGEGGSLDSLSRSHIQRYHGRK
jgi:flagellar protein FlgJ